MALPTTAQLSDEQGFSIVEVVVAAILVVILALGLFAVLDTTGSEAANTQERSTALSIVSSEQQRLRSLSATQSLANYRTTSTVTAPAGTSTRTFTVTSQVDQVRDAGGVVSCTRDATAPDYLRTRTSVTWDGARAPVTSSSFISPSPGSVALNLGTLAVHVSDRNGTDVENMPVTAAGRNSSTNEVGCAVFSYVPAGPATVTAGQSGWVDPTGANPATATPTVVARQLANQELRMDRAGAISATFEAADRFASATTPTISANPATAQSIRLTNSDPDFTPARTSDVTSTSPRTALTAALFPFLSAYSVYAGDCAAQDPALYSPAKDTAANLKSALVAPGSTKPVTVRMPSVLVQVKSGSPATVQTGTSVTVRLKPVGTGCVATYAASPTASGYATIPAPYGNYTICASTTGGARSPDLTGVTNYDPSGYRVADAKALALSTTTSAAGTC